MTFKAPSRVNPTKLKFLGLTKAGTFEKTVGVSKSKNNLMVGSFVSFSLVSI